MIEPGINNYMILRTALVIGICFILTCSYAPSSHLLEVGSEEIKPLSGYSTYSRFPHGDFRSRNFNTWKRFVPGIRIVRIKSTADGTMQPSLFYDSGTKTTKPLLVVLHSWTNNYLQNISIPYGEWAVQNDWVFIHPDSRGVYDKPASTASEKAVMDILDAVEWAKKNASIDESRIYLTGYSGGAMTALVMTGRYPELWAAVSAWVPIYDLYHWYQYTSRFPGRHYSRHIRQSVGGTPKEGNDAWMEAMRRSPASYLSHAAGHDLKVYIASGIDDDNVPVDHALMAYNDLADEEDKILEEDIEYMRENTAVPPHLRVAVDDPEFTSVGLPVVFERESSNVVLKVFSGGHDVIYNAGLIWMSQQSR